MTGGNGGNAHPQAGPVTALSSSTGLSTPPAPQRVAYLLHVGIAHGLGDALAFIVAGSGSYGIHVAPVILGLRVDFRVCGGGGGKQEGSAFRVSLCSRSYTLRTVDTDGAKGSLGKTKVNISPGEIPIRGAPSAPLGPPLVQQDTLF